MGESRKADSLDSVLAQRIGRSYFHQLAPGYRAEFAAMKADRTLALALLRESRAFRWFETYFLHTEPAPFLLRGDPAFEEIMQLDR